MRYSMRWILAAMVYVAIAAAAFSQESWVYADLLWLVTFVAIIYAGLLICTARESRRVCAIGFIFGAAAFLTCLQFAPGSLPTVRLERYIREPARLITPQELHSTAMLQRDTARPRAINAVATMLSGLVGCLLGSLAYHRARRDALRPDAEVAAR